MAESDPLLSDPNDLTGQPPRFNGLARTTSYFNIALTYMTVSPTICKLTRWAHRARSGLQYWTALHYPTHG